MISTTEEVYEELKKEGINISTKYSYSHPDKTEGKTKKLSLGRIWFNSILPDDFRLFNEEIDKKKLDEIIKDIGDTYDPETASEYIRNIQKHANHMATFDPRTFNINMFTPSQEWKEEKKKFLEEAEHLSTDEFNQKRKELIVSLKKEMKEADIPFIDALDAKSGKVNEDTWALMQVSKGVTADIEGNVKIIPEAISDGYNIEHYYDAAAEARNGFYVKSTAVQDPGYLSRKVTMANAGTKLDKTDCKSKKYLEVFVDKDRAQNFAGRYMLYEGELVLIEDPENIANQNIKIRSPLYCKSKNGICQICYGKLAEELNTDNIGILAGGAINNSAVNSMMKLRHQSEKIKTVDVNFPEIVRKSTVNINELNHILEIDEKDIYAKDEVIVEIDKHEYDEVSLTEYHDKYKIPGLITLRHGHDEPNYYSLPFNFEVNLIKPNIIETRGRIITLTYNKGEKIINKDQYIKGVNPAVITKILDGITKYVKDPRILVDMLSEELSNIDNVHLELVVANMFRDADDKKMPARLNNYKNPVIIGSKKTPFIDSWLSSLAFQDIGNAIETGLVNEEDAQFNDIEKVLIRDSYKIKE